MATVELMVKCRKIWEYEEIQDIMLIDCTKQLIYEQPIFCGFLIFLVTNYCNIFSVFLGMWYRTYTTARCHYPRSRKTIV